MALLNGIKLAILFISALFNTYSQIKKLVVTPGRSGPCFFLIVDSFGHTGKKVFSPMRISTQIFITNFFTNLNNNTSSLEDTNCANPSFFLLLGFKYNILLPLYLSLLSIVILGSPKV
jgi:hypothetical protein|tara:strand:+ start:384 stop:737 length:354 start_codon:yes stop_codon:yes gene_type:complete